MVTSCEEHLTAKQHKTTACRPAWRGLAQGRGKTRVPHPLPTPPMAAAARETRRSGRAEAEQRGAQVRLPLHALEVERLFRP